MSNNSSEKNASVIEFFKAIATVLGGPGLIFTIVNNISQQPIVSLGVAIIIGILLTGWLAISRKMNLAYLAIGWLSLLVIILLGFVIWPNTMTIEGYVSDSTSQPVINETVRFFDYHGQIYETRTDQNGFYQFVDVPTGKYKIRVRTTEIQGESRGLLVRVVSQSIAVSPDDGEIANADSIDPQIPHTSKDAISVDEITETPTPKPTTTFTSTPKPVGTATPTNTPDPSPTPTPAIKIVKTSLLDNFDDNSFDGSFNNSLWYQAKSDKGNTCSITQKEGALFVSQATGLYASPCELTTKQSANWLLADLNQIKGRLRLVSKEGDGYGNVSIALVSNESDWFMTCHSAKYKDHGPYMNCWTPEWEEPENPGGVGLESLDSWHEFEMRINPETVTFEFYMDGYYYASYTPPEAAELKDDSFYVTIGSYGDPKISATGWIDDVYIGSNQ